MTKKPTTQESPMAIVKVATCPTLSGRSELTYHLGRDPESEAYIRVVQNTGNGQFNADWVSLSLIEKLLIEHPQEKPLTSRVMAPVFRGKSSNSPAFLFAVLKTEGVVISAPEKDSGYLLGSLEAFRQSVAALATVGVDTAVDTQSEAPPEPSKKRRPAKEPA